MPSTQEEQISLKLLVYKKTNKVILAEAGKDFVDVLFCFLTMPLGTIARLVQTSDLGPGGVGCLSSLYGSVTNLQDYDLLSAFKNESFNCGDLLARSVSVKSDKVYNGFVKDVATFIVTDDLVVIPNAMDSSFGVLQKFGVKSWSSIQEMTVNVTKKKDYDYYPNQSASNYEKIRWEGYSSIGSIDGLYNSIVGLNENKYLIAKEVKNRLVDPGLAPQFKLSMKS
ncbi:hypothetical protein JHK82_018489 [Glycine max]|nr:hypothetical protein JHK85_018921 [Glycine max]KAG5142794.1 hypothetical protein JHK82_018489 [Glycine max]